MPIVGISITKETSFRDSVQEFSNVYYFNNGVGGVPSAIEAGALIDEIVTSEKPWHATTVTFKYGRCWHQTLTQIGTVMLQQKALTGTGTLTEHQPMDKERAYLFRWRAGNDSRGNPVYLRKWYHTCAQFPGSTLSTDILMNKTGFSQAIRDTMAGHVQAVWAIGAGNAFELCSKGGRPTDGNSPTAHKYLEHHQLGDMWRAG